MKKRIRIMLSFLLVLSIVSSYTVAFALEPQIFVRDEILAASGDSGSGRLNFEDGSFVDWKYNITDSSVTSDWIYSNGKQEHFVTKLSSGQTIRTVKENSTSKTTVEYNRDIADAYQNQTSQIQPNFTTSYVNIGSVTYNYDTITNETLVLSVKAKQVSVHNDKAYTVNGEAYDTISSVVQDLASLLSIAKIVPSWILAYRIVSDLLSFNFVNGIVKAAFTEDVRIKGNDYRISVSDAASGNVKEFDGSRYRVTSPGNLNGKLMSIDYYPQFIADKDLSVANSLFIEFRGFGVNPGVNKWNVVRVVDSNT